MLKISNKNSTLDMQYNQTIKDTMINLLDDLYDNFGLSNQAKLEVSICKTLIENKNESDFYKLAKPFEIIRDKIHAKDKIIFDKKYYSLEFKKYNITLGDSEKLKLSLSRSKKFFTMIASIFRNSNDENQSVIWAYFRRIDNLLNK
jgi:hypothetical protein